MNQIPQGHSTQPQPPRDIVAQELRSELRRAFRKLDDLSSPIRLFVNHPHQSPPRPHLVACVLGPPRLYLQNGVNTRHLAYPDERIQDLCFDFARCVWHLRDRFVSWYKSDPTLNEKKLNKYLHSRPDILVCSDLINWKKHGLIGEKSGQMPHVGGVHFDLSNSGIVDACYDGAAKEACITVSIPEPISFSVDIVDSAICDPYSIIPPSPESIIDDAYTLFRRALLEYKQIANESGILNGADREAEHINMLFESL